MYEHSEKENWNRFKLEAAIHGVDVENVMEQSEEKKRMPEKKKDEGLFKDPEEYKDLSQNEREALTQQMMGRLKKWAEGKDNPLNRGK